MLIHDLTPEECREFVRRLNVARLACTRDDQPYVVPVSYSFDAARDCLYSFSAVGQKVAWMRANPRVCVEVEEIADDRHWTTVLIFGRYEEILDADDERDARDRAQQLFRLRSEWWLPGAARVTSHEHHAVVLYRITIERVSGRRASRDTT